MLGHGLCVTPEYSQLLRQVVVGLSSFLDQGLLARWRGTEVDAREGGLR